MEVNTLLKEEINRAFIKLKEVEPGSDEYDNIVKDAMQLVDRATEVQKVDDERVDKKTHAKHNLTDVVVRNSLTALSIVGGFAITVWGTKATFKFEKDGYIPTTILGRGFINKLLPKK